MFSLELGFDFHLFLLWSHLIPSHLCRVTLDSRCGFRMPLLFCLMDQRRHLCWLFRSLQNLSMNPSSLSLFFLSRGGRRDSLLPLPPYSLLWICFSPQPGLSIFLKCKSSNDYLMLLWNITGVSSHVLNSSIILLIQDFSLFPLVWVQVC